MNSTTIPNLLTFMRIALIPVVVILFYFDRPISNWIVAVIFIFACITDYLDGYFARTLKQTSRFGIFLDPIADKLLVAATILMLVGFGRIGGLSLIPAVIILCREILVSGLREFLAEVRVSVPVTRLAKWKTGIQMTALSLLIIEHIPNFPLPLEWIGTFGLWVAAILTLMTGFDYLRAGLKHM
ncbi:MAG: CDP-diacylglycerol-glycerol-3-phosphate 3-phosphatidyltransferase [uncultured bacterium]|nr:MAG: CDP-diacylglycerol-glycerol-3-phosphate 3-phosphatidyltransferase [uncultured bacterium]OFW68501.1 MAG: CDP-diacylglycerol--glycerol-3-phosphate 3-phosphatidyltransferase [Alphaproteobacteria bacterium GWC2_42_16]OFW73192.1 MAG: CDP-diacylglycerol--glycerol-3-phosphate 3-phosphatidyltransferase [Alphaproteobacteria bacterium GWA2_41_27]OFW81563.1 MAG: CDP-diacylglycerol--glycerol-3-phosphate 3-phosphatidyltransferase [Alphaproteobacteria bacterium RIFCSPHIGHO2_12_FULL_42_100]OFW85337.1 